MSQTQKTLNPEKLHEKNAQVLDNVATCQKIIDATVKQYTSNLDEVMRAVEENIVHVKNPSSEVLEKYFLELSNSIYFASESTERLGIYDAVARMTLQDAQNTILLNKLSGTSGTKKPTVAELTALSESGSLTEQALNDIYNKTYKIVRAKIDAANTMIATISKIVSKRMSENSLSGFSLTSNNTEVI